MCTCEHFSHFVSSVIVFRLNYSGKLIICANIRLNTSRHITITITIVKKILKKDGKFIILAVAVFLAVLVYLLFSASKVPREEVVNQANVIQEEVVVEKTPELELLGKAELSFAGGTDGRGKNIQLGVERFNGKVIAPGEEFSFGETLGTVSEEDGFSVEKVFQNGEVTKGIGGGLCQVSTLLFQTVLNSALPVTERHNHSYTVSYYDVGLDATFAEGGPDFKFINDTEYPITIIGRTEDQKAIFEIFGVSDGRVGSTTEPEITKIVDFPPTKYVHVSALEEGEPECINKPQIGYTAEVLYTIAYPSGIQTEKKFISNYRPLQRVCFIVDGKVPISI